MNYYQKYKQRRQKIKKNHKPYSYSKPLKNYFATWDYWNKLLQDNKPI